MIVVLAIPVVVLSHYAGGWGVPYFSFTTDRGGKCTNTFTGYECDHLTLGDINWWGNLDLPEQSKVLRAHYTSGQEVKLDAVVVVDKDDAKSAARSLRKTFGSCGRERPANIKVDKLKHRCIMANQESESRARHGPLSDREYVIATGLRDDGSRIVGIKEKSR